MPVLFTYDGDDLVDINLAAYRKWVSDVAAIYLKKVGEIAYIFCDDPYILKINKEYLNHDYYTDVITFDYSKKKVIAGDIFISMDTVRSNAILYKTNFIDEFNRVFIHGILHLCGLMDHTDEDELNMRKAEDEALILLSNLLS